MDVHKISLFKQSDNEYFIRHEDLSKMSIVPLQLKNLENKEFLW